MGAERLIDGSNHALAVCEHSSLVAVRIGQSLVFCNTGLDPRRYIQEWVMVDRWTGDAFWNCRY